MRTAALYRSVLGQTKKYAAGAPSKKTLARVFATIRGLAI